MKVGDKVKMAPTMVCKAGIERNDPLDGVITYIHPKRIFYMVEFTAPGGRKFSESFFIGNRRGNGKYYG